MAPFTPTHRFEIYFAYDVSHDNNIEMANLSKEIEEIINSAGIIQNDNFIIQCHVAKIIDTHNPPRTILGRCVEIQIMVKTTDDYIYCRYDADLYEYVIKPSINNILNANLKCNEIIDINHLVNSYRLVRS